jgi:Uma2 family endonuclease
VAGEEPEEQIFRSPPHICIEIRSPHDSVVRMQDRIDDYLRLGVPHVWVLNPANRRAWAYTVNVSMEVMDGVLRATNPDIILPLADLFTDIDAG